MINLKHGKTINDEINKLSKLRIETIGTSISSKDMDSLIYIQKNIDTLKNHIGKPERIQTDFYKNSIKFDEMYSKTDQRYWQSNTEMFARAFACYIKDNLQGRNDYLCGHSELALGITINENNELGIIEAYPKGKEREMINECIKEVIEFAKEKQILHDRNIEMQKEYENELE